VALHATAPLAAGDPRAGAGLAQQWCASCHVVSERSTSPVPQGPPTFVWIAQHRNAEELRTFLVRPHPPMPNFDLSRANIDDLVAYIESLR
jgi:mono/diheme cytochrome c family protein